LTPLRSTITHVRYYGTIEGSIAVTFKMRNLILPVLTTACALWLVSGSAIVAQAASSDIVLYASKAPVRKGTWAVVADSTAAGGYAMRNPNLGAPTITAPLPSPANYFELTFPAYSAKAYHLWIRGKSAGNSTNNDSVYVQFSDSVTSTGSPTNRIGTTSGMAVILQACTGAAVHGWGWTDNGWCGLGANVFFHSTGTHTVRVQVREDGLSIDQIALSPNTYLSTAPGKAIDDTTILAANLPTLSPQVSVSANPSSGVAPVTVNFTANVNLSSGYITAYNWSFGDGQTSVQALPSHLYQSPGNYTARVTVTDNNGTKASASTLMSVGGSGSFRDSFNTGSLDATKWLASNEPAPGNISGVNYGSFVSSNVDLSQGMLSLKLTQQQGTPGVLSVGGQLQSLTTYGYGTYEWVMRASSTSTTPTGAGSVVSGQISAAFSFVNNSETEIDFEIEGQHANTVWMTNWISTTQKQYSSVFLASPDAGFHHYKFVWGPGRIDFYIDDVLVSTHTSNVPSAPAYIMINHWGTNSTGWGGLATLGVERYLYVSSFSYTP
jgi:endo-1,3-1,4-beta-glycanase ExoK